MRENLLIDCREPLEFTRKDKELVLKIFFPSQPSKIFQLLFYKDIVRNRTFGWFVIYNNIIKMNHLRVCCRENKNTYYYFKYLNAIHVERKILFFLYIFYCV